MNADTNRARPGRRTRAGATALVGIATAASACTTILGVSDVHFGDAGGTASDGATDGSTRDGAMDGTGPEAPIPHETSGGDAGVTIFATSMGTPQGIAVGTTYVCWTYNGEVKGGGGVQCRARDGSGSTFSVAKDQTSLLDIGISGENVAWSVGNVPVSGAGSAGTPPQECLVMASPILPDSDLARCALNVAYWPLRMAVADGYVTLLVRGSAATLAGYAPLFAAPGGLDGAAPPTYDVTHVASSASAIGVNSAAMLIGDSTQVAFLPLPSLGDSGLTCASDCGTGGVQDLAVGLVDAYWLTSGGDVGMAPATGGPIVTLGQVTGMPQRIAVDDTAKAVESVYVTTSTGATSGAVYAVPTSSTGAWRMFESSGCSPFGVAVQGHDLFWTCIDGAILHIVIPK
jgi:hypothetical protein